MEEVQDAPTLEVHIKNAYTEGGALCWPPAIVLPEVEHQMRSPAPLFKNFYVLLCTQTSIPAIIYFQTSATLSNLIHLVQLQDFGSNLQLALLLANNVIFLLVPQDSLFVF